MFLEYCSQTHRIMTIIIYWGSVKRYALWLWRGGFHCPAIQYERHCSVLHFSRTLSLFHGWQIMSTWAICSFFLPSFQVWNLPPACLFLKHSLCTWVPIHPGTLLAHPTGVSSQPVHRSTAFRDDLLCRAGMDVISLKWYPFPRLKRLRELSQVLCVRPELPLSEFYIL